MRIIGKDNGLHKVEINGVVEDLTDAELDELMPGWRGEPEEAPTLTEGWDAVASIYSTERLIVPSLSGQGAELLKRLQGESPSDDDDVILTDLHRHLDDLYGRTEVELITSLLAAVESPHEIPADVEPVLKELHAALDFRYPITKTVLDLRTLDETLETAFALLPSDPKTLSDSARASMVALGKLVEPAPEPDEATKPDAAKPDAPKAKAEGK